MNLHRIVLFLLLLAPANARAQAPAPLQLPKPTPIHGAHYPALSPDGKMLCFEYQGDLWTVSSEGGTATRLTVHPAYDAYPRWSPDGRWIAFSSNREGNFDIYLIPARGGEARQITCHSADDYVMDWSPDGAQILFASAREGRFTDLYTISLKDGRLRRLTDDRTMSRYAVFSPDGMMVAYARGGQAWWRPKYRGSQNADIWALWVRENRSVRLTDYDGWDSFPLYAPDGKSIFYVSQQDGTSNLWRLPLSNGRPEQITHHVGGAVRYPTIARIRDGCRIAYEYNFDIWVIPFKAWIKPTMNANEAMDAARRPLTLLPPQPIKIYAPGDLLASQTQRLTLNSGVASIALSPDGKTLAFAARGELWTVPVEGGDAARLTKNGSAEYGPVWSPDGRTLAYTTDRSGSLDVYLMDVKMKAETPVATDASDETNPKFSPDGRFLSWTHGGGPESGLYVLPLPPDGPVKPSEAVRVAPGPGVGSYDWSPDAKWLIYSKRDATGTTDLWIVPSVGGTPVNITRYPGMNTNPQWSRDGRYIVFRSSRGSAPGSFTANLYALRLIPEPPRDEGTPEGARGRGGEGNEEIGKWGNGANDSRLTTHDSRLTSPKDPITQSPNDPDSQRRRRPPVPPPGQGGQTGALPAQPPASVPPRATNVVIEFEDIQNRARAITNTRDSIGGGALLPDARTVIFTMAQGGGPPDWWAADIVTGTLTRLTTGGDTGGDVEFAPDASKFYFLGANGTIRQLVRNTPAPTPVNFSASMVLDRRIEVAEAFNEAWRSLRTGFYDPKMHGADWSALRARYEPLLAETVAKEDFAWLLSAMIGELNASHLGVTPPAEPGPTTTTGYLGLSFDPAYAGPGLKVTERLKKGPADQVGRRIEPGEYIMAIDGQDVALNEDLYRTLRDKPGQNVGLLVNNKPVKEGARTVRVRPVTKAQADDLEYEQWVETRRKKVETLSGGQLAYIHIRAMNQPSLQQFQREIFGDAQSKKGLVLDVRFNGGGRIHDELLEILTRRPHVYEIPRDGERATQPFQLWNRPTVLLINEYSASDAEIFPNGFREYGLGKIVGVPTYGAVIGTSDITLVDGTRFRVPRTGWYTLEGKNMENYGVPPDVRVEQTPEDNAADNDRQLEAAVKLLLQQMGRKG